jgi:hypothetical protein
MEHMVSRPTRGLSGWTYAALLLFGIAAAFAAAAWVGKDVKPTVFDGKRAMQVWHEQAVAKCIPARADPGIITFNCNGSVAKDAMSQFLKKHPELVATYFVQDTNSMHLLVNMR